MKPTVQELEQSVLSRLKSFSAPITSGATSHEITDPLLAHPIADVRMQGDAFYQTPVGESVGTILQDRAWLGEVDPFYKSHLNTTTVAHGMAPYFEGGGLTLGETAKPQLNKREWEDTDSPEFARVGLSNMKRMEPMTAARGVVPLGVVAHEMGHIPQPTLFSLQEYYNRGIDPKDDKEVKILEMIPRSIEVAVNQWLQAKAPALYKNLPVTQEAGKEAVRVLRKGKFGFKEVQRFMQSDAFDSFMRNTVLRLLQKHPEQFSNALLVDSKGTA